MTLKFFLIVFFWRFMPAVLTLGVPENVKNFYDSVRAQGTCNKTLGTGFQLADSESDTDSSYTYFGDYNGLIFLQGVEGRLADMDVDYDGQTVSLDDDKICDKSQDTIGETSFKSDLQQYGIADLNPYIQSYSVFGNQGRKTDFVNFEPQDFGMQPLSVMAVVCGNQTFYGVRGDENGDDQPRAAIGEASLSVTTLCYGQSIDGNAGHSEADFLYAGFTGNDAVAGTNIAWDANDANTFPVKP